MTALPTQSTSGFSELLGEQAQETREDEEEEGVERTPTPSLLDYNLLGGYQGTTIQSTRIANQGRGGSFAEAAADDDVAVGVEVKKEGEDQGEDVPLTPAALGNLFIPSFRSISAGEYRIPEKDKEKVEKSQ